VVADLARELDAGAHLIDTALAAHLVGATAADLARPESRWFGPLLESYVVGEVAKQAGWHERPVTLSHYRDRDQREVDLLLEQGREVVAVEVKATATPVAAHAKHPAFLRDRIGGRFRGGVVLHTGTQRVPLGDRLCAVPVASLWS
jgi:predicted AAA+ superfamily ATPase